MGQGAGLPKLAAGLLALDGLEQLEHEFTECLDKESGNGADEVTKMASTIEILHGSCKARILSLADKLAANQVPKSISLVHENVEVEIPVNDSWDFKLGDWVRIRYSMPAFRNIQLRTLGWKPRLSTIHSFDSVVTKRRSSFENGVTIYTPTMLSVSVVYAGLWEKIPDSERRKGNVVVSRWKVNDYVMIGLHDDRAFTILQRGLDTIPKKLMMRRGKIIAVTKAAIVVTFNERTSYHVNSAVLTKCQNQETPLSTHQRHHGEGFGVGDKCKVISDIRKLVENQSGDSGWSADMTKIAGKEVTIIHIKKNGKLMVQYKQGKCWAINPKSLIASLETSENDDSADERPSKRGDIVKVTLIEDIMGAIRKAKVPTSLLEYLRMTAELQLVDGDFDYMIKYNCNQQVNVLASTLRKATEDEKHNHYKVKDLVEKIKAGSSVFLDVGPPRYVKSVLRDFSVPTDVVRALTTASILTGYEHGGKAVIEYEDGLRYKVKKKYLTVPEKFNIPSSRDGPSLELIKSIEENIKTTVAQKDHRAGETPVRVISMSVEESPASIDFRVYSNETSINDISENLIKLDLKVVQRCGNWFYVSGAQCFEGEIKISILFNDEPSLKNEFEKSPSPNYNNEDFVHTKKKDIITEGERAATARKRNAPGPIFDELQSHGIQIERSQVEDVQVRDPSVITLRGYKYLRLSQSLYLPLCIGVPNGELFTSENESGCANTAGPSTMINLNVSQSKVDKIKLTGGN